MKKTLLFAWMVLSGMCFIACSSDDDNNNNEPPVEERVHDLDVFTDRLITVDDLGNLEGVNIGQALNSNVAPEVYSVQVKDLEEAKAMFMELVDGFTDISTAGDDITVVLYDAEGKEQGKVYFKKSSGAELATMTYEGFTVQGITTLRYIDNWPALGATTSKWRLYDIVTVPSDKEGNPRGVCIREYSNGTNGMIICPTSYESGYQDWRSNTCLETMMKMGEQVKKLGVDNVSARLKKAGLYSDLSKYYWSNTTKFYFFDKGHWKVRLSDGDDKYVSSWEVALSNNNANNAYTYYFNGNGKCW